MEFLPLRVPRIEIHNDGMKSLSARAPGRVELLGNHTDYNEGYVLSSAINHAVTAHGVARDNGIISLRSKEIGTPIEVSLETFEALSGDQSWANYPLGVIRILREEGFALGGMEIEFSSDLPRGAGLSSSAALEVATGRLAMKLFHLDIEPMRLAKICRRAENDFVGVKCGLLDQVSSIFGRSHQVVHLDCRTEQVANIPLPGDVALLVFHCGVEHRLAGGEYNERREQCFAAAAALGAPALRDVSAAQLHAAREQLDPLVFRRAAHVVGENERVLLGVELLRKGDGRAFGELMFASHESSRVNFENSTPELDTLVELAREERGVLGSRLTGGGFGGATISLVERIHAVEAAVHLAENYLARTGNQGRAYLCESADGAA
jgi:galactokinase